MKNQSIKILFLISATRINKKGLVPLICRITYIGKRRSFASGIFINPCNWHSSLQIAKPPGNENNLINTQLSLIKQEINQAFLFLKVQKMQFDVDDIYLKYKGVDVKPSKTLMEVFTIHNAKMNLLIGIEYTKSTYSKFIEAKQHTEDFLFYHYKKKNVLLENINLKFLDDFDFYLKTQKGFKQITINKSIQRVRKIIKLAIAEGFIVTDPFLLYKPKKVFNNVIYLTTEELLGLENYNFSQPRLDQVRDLFIFCCYTGLPYQEMATLTKKNIIKKFDDKLWIDMFRMKTKKQLTIPLLPKAISILEKYQNNKNILPLISNQKFNSYIKEIAEIIGIEKNLTHHIARKTFATTVLLYNDVPMEIVSELLGHSKISTTQEHYAKVVQKKVSQEMSKLSQKLKVI
ncbi:site-specific integrase [Flavobacterium nackdongense]|uniref:Site-specific integrase n=1 Tax=Flavobacterium nackdongense TaxID=2547394 RepID=A0A4P6YG25_9FLAO|nr:site-specific integrase [Flavobacterium nackdongense]QBN19745.1 site-specific integrase [Flavobacterium nackdongense]